MIKLTITTSDGSFDLQGSGDIQASNAIDCIVCPENRSIEISASRQLTGDEWYSNFILNKRVAMINGGNLSSDQLIQSDDPNIFDFQSGYLGYLTGKLLTVQGVAPHADGNLTILGSGLLEVGTTSSSSDNPDASSGLQISLPKHHPRINAMYRDIYLMIWRIYHCLNSISGRLQLYAPTMERDGNAAITTMGYYLGTYQNYQALVARWNHFAWSNSFTLEIIESGERASVIVGYTNLNCESTGFAYDLDIYLLKTATESDSGSSASVQTVDVITPQSSPTPRLGANSYFDRWTDASPPTVEDVLDSDAELIDKWSRLITIFDQGVESTLNVDNFNIVTSYERNQASCTGTGYEGQDPAPLVALDDPGMTASVLPPALSLHTSVTRLNANYIWPENYHRNVVAIAPCSGTLLEYGVQRPPASVFHLFVAEATWSVGGVTFTKRKSFKLAAVTNGKIEEDEEEGEDV